MLELQSVMLARRIEVACNQIPEGILTQFNSGDFQIVFDQIKKDNHSLLLRLGQYFLKLSEDCISQLNQALKNRSNDFSISTYDENSINKGFTIVLCEKDLDVERKKLEFLSKKNKYLSKSDTWFGLLLNRTTLKIYAVNCLDERWARDKNLEKDIRYFEHMSKRPESKTIIFPSKIGRNELCPCNSGKKYKRCCGQ